MPLFSPLNGRQWEMACLLGMKCTGLFGTWGKMVRCRQPTTQQPDGYRFEYLWKEIDLLECKYGISFLFLLLLLLFFFHSGGVLFPDVQEAVYVLLCPLPATTIAWRPYKSNLDIANAKVTIFCLPDVGTGDGSQMWAWKRTWIMGIMSFCLPSGDVLPTHLLYVKKRCVQQTAYLVAERKKKKNTTIKVGKGECDAFTTR